MGNRQYSLARYSLGVVNCLGVLYLHLFVIYFFTTNYFFYYKLCLFLLQFSKIDSAVSIFFTPPADHALLIFENTVYAEYAIKKFNGTELEGSNIKVDWAMRFRPEEKNIFIKNLEKSVDEECLRSMFSTFGVIEDIVIPKSPINNASLGYAFIQFSNQVEVKNAINSTNGMFVLDHKIIVQQFRNREQHTDRYNNLFVKNFGDKFTEEQMREIFSKFGRITRLSVPLNNSNNSKGFGFVEFESSQSALQAVKNCHEMIYNGRKLYVGRAFQKKNDATLLKSLGNITVCISNLADNIDGEYLVPIFSKYGPLSYADVMSCEGPYRGMGYVTFVNGESAQQAQKELDGSIMESRKIKIVIQIPPGRR